MHGGKTTIAQSCQQNIGRRKSDGQVVIDMTKQRKLNMYAHDFSQQEAMPGTQGHMVTGQLHVNE